MPEQRMDLNAAGKLLGVTANAVRARWKKGHLQGDRDNTGKIWVIIDTDKAANDRPPAEPFEALIEPELKPSNQGLIEALEGHIESLKGENEALKLAVADALRRLDLSEDERRKLVAALLEKQAVPAPAAAPERLPWLLRWLGGIKS